MPLVFALKLAVQVTLEPFRSIFGAMANAESRISSLPLTGTVVVHCPPLNVVVAHVAFGSKMIFPAGAVKVTGLPFFGVTVTVELKKIVAPVEGTPLAEKLALNQMNLPSGGIGVPLKLVLRELG